jgi:hypothetical protein
MVLCDFERECGNAGSVKCQICDGIAKTGKFEHRPGFKDKRYYAKTLPLVPDLTWLFKGAEG